MEFVEVDEFVVRIGVAPGVGAAGRATCGVFPFLFAWEAVEVAVVEMGCEPACEGGRFVPGDADDWVIREGAPEAFIVPECGLVFAYALLPGFKASGGGVVAGEPRACCGVPPGLVWVISACVDEGGVVCVGEWVAREFKCGDGDGCVVDGVGVPVVGFAAEVVVLCGGDDVVVFIGGGAEVVVRGAEGDEWEVGEVAYAGARVADGAEVDACADAFAGGEVWPGEGFGKAVREAVPEVREVDDGGGAEFGLPADFAQAVAGEECCTVPFVWVARAGAVGVEEEEVEPTGGDVAIVAADHAPKCEEDDFAPASWVGVPVLVGEGAKFWFAFLFGEVAGGEVFLVGEVREAVEVVSFMDEEAAFFFEGAQDEGGTGSGGAVVEVEGAEEVEEGFAYDATFEEAAPVGGARGLVGAVGEAFEDAAYLVVAQAAEAWFLGAQLGEEVWCSAHFAAVCGPAGEEELGHGFIEVGAVVGECAFVGVEHGDEGEEQWCFGEVA